MGIRKEGKMRMLELLAPGGSYEGLKAAVNAGADAIYMGGTRFGARAYAQNPEEKELLSAMDYCHLHGRKLYLTVNTLLKETEVERELYDYLLPIYEHGLDAVLVQDLGVFQFIQRNFPGLPLHASTQMTITGVDGARLLKRMGAERIVPSRELSLKEIAQIHREVEIEIECFVHGALCYCYSGQCLMSSLIGGRSGNRGRCAQPCRLPYDLYRGEERQNSEKERYLLSLKDICTLQLLPDLIEAGVCSFKMEGRMKRPEYAAGVTEIYRKYIDLYCRRGRKGYSVDPQDERILMDLYNRGGFSRGYYEIYNGKTMMTMERPNHWGTPAAKVVGVKCGQLRLKALEPLWEGDALETGSTEAVLKENVSTGKEFLVSHNPRLAKTRVQSGQILARVRCEKLLQNLQENYMKREIREKIKGKFILNRENSAILTVRWKNMPVTVTGGRAEAADRRPLDEETVRRQLMKTGNTPFVFEELEVVVGENLFYPMQNLNEMRRSALEQLQEMILKEYRRSVAEEKTAVQDCRKEEEADQRFRINEEETSQSDAVNVMGMNESFELRASVETEAQLIALLDQPAVTGVYLDCCMFMKPFPKERGREKEPVLFEQAVQMLHQHQKKCYVMLPMIWREHVRTAFENAFPISVLNLADGFLLRSSEQLEYFHRLSGSLIGKKEMIADAGIYTYNKEARKFLRSCGIHRDTLPLECNRRELQQRGCAGSEAIVYGYLPLMVTAQCVVKNTAGCRKNPGILKLKDRKNVEFPVRNQCSICTNLIYNSVPLELISSSSEILELHPCSCRLAFTFEDQGEVKRIVKAAEDCFLNGQKAGKVTASGTKGHFKRGVE